MTAPTKMTEERAREIINQEYDSRMTARECWTAGEARGFLEGLQAGRAEMAEENQRYRVALERISEGEIHRVPNVNGGTSSREECSEWDRCNCERVEAKEALSQRGGGPK